MEDNTKIGTRRVAEEIGIGLRVLGAYLAKHPDLRPQEKIGFNHLWTRSEVDRLIAFRNRPKPKGGRPKRQQTKGEQTDALPVD